MNATTELQRQADELEAKIMAEVASGRFKLILNSGYCSYSPLDQACCGCALGAAAFATIGSRDYGWTTIPGRRDSYAASQLPQECAAQLEMGYEEWNVLTYSYDKFGGGAYQSKANEDHPFFKLGQKLRARATVQL